ncbi:LssY C-terminal domain-containing protein [Mesorhizobium koreense]|uniref:LssY C-terminal domain-containing protein n=1 Tax=Mesorhizobium koreense TaxID=3074855 RepID=UPI00287B97A2|nr:LssY C-terminal domain-containing protein [Mesorhizobium sp. WR6]
MSERPSSLLRRHRRLLGLLAAVVVLYVTVAYFVLPLLWVHYEHQRGLTGLPMVTRTGDDLPGDPLNIGMVGATEDLVHAMHAAGWHPADPVTFRTSIGIIGSVVLDRPYPDAPVSPLFLDGRREDLAFEKPDGRSADRRHHVRLWRVLENGEEGRPVWLGAATFDKGVGISRYTGQVTHHIAPDIDAERELLAHELEAAKMATETYEVSGIGPTLLGRNGGGDPYYTDGEIRVLVLTRDGRPATTAPVNLPSPPLIEWKNRLWHGVAD